MRNIYHNKLKKFFRKKLLATRSELNLTQEQMSEKLSMSVRSYSDLEGGKSTCGVLTLVLFLIYFCPDTKQFLNELKKVYESDDDFEEIKN